MTDPRGQFWTSLYDQWDRLQATVDPLGNRSTIVYDPSGRVSALWDARGSRWTTTCNARDLAIGTTDPLGRKATYSYDATGQLATYTDQKGQLATLTFSARYDLTGEQYADGTRMTYSYDGVGQLRTVVDATGWHTMTYNLRRELTNVQSPQHPSGGILTYAYDANGNRTAIFSWLGPQTMTYDALDRCTSLLLDSASKLTTWLYDGLNRPTMQFHWNGARTTWAYDPRGRTNFIRHSTNANALLDFASYTYDQAVNPLTRATNSTRATWSYDNASQLQTEQHSATGLDDTLVYDPAGNRIQRSRTQSGALTVSTYAYDAAGQLVTMLAGTALTTFAFDGNGNLQSENTAPTGITTYLWDALDRMRGVQYPSGAPSTYAYRYDNLRASQNTGAGVQTSVWDVPGPTGFGDLFEELDASGNRLRAYFRALDLAAQQDGTGTYAFHWMDVGTAQLLSDVNQVSQASYAFSAWGELLSLVGGASTPLSWNGRWGYYRDTSARTWVRARHLDVLRGRWFSRDPIGFGSGVVNLYRNVRKPKWGPIGHAGGLNAYRYVRGNPVRGVDPLGLLAIVEVSGFNVTITLPIRYVGKYDTPAIEKEFNADIEKTWSGPIGPYTVKTTCVAPSAKYPTVNVITVDKAKNSEDVSAVHGTDAGPGDTGRWLAGDTRVEIGHEAGHLMGLIDEYDPDTGKPYENFESNIMANTLNGIPWGSDIKEITRINPTLSQYYVKYSKK